MRHKTFLPVYILAIILIGNIENSNAQFLKKLKDKVSKTATETVQKVLPKKVDQINEPQKPKSKEGNKEDNQGTTNNNKSKKQQTQEIDYSDIYTIKSPYPEFKTIHLQSYKGLPRFGALNFYMKNRTSPLLTSESNEKRKMLTAGYTGFRKLALMNIFKDYIKFIDKESLTPKTKSGDFTEKEIKSYNTQTLIRDLALYLTTDEIKGIYFCKDPTQINCAKNTNKWGGYYSDDFTENEKYVDFVKKYLEKLSQWSTNFFKDGTEVMYLINRAKFNANGYDFDKNGYWVSLPIRKNYFPHDYTSTQDQYFFKFSPETTYGNELLNKINQVKYIKGEVLFKISPEKAEALVKKKIPNIYLVSKVKVVFKEIITASPYFHLGSYSYHYESPVLEIYEDAALTQKISEISLENLTYKEE